MSSITSLTKKTSLNNSITHLIEAVVVLVVSRKGTVLPSFLMPQGITSWRLGQRRVIRITRMLIQWELVYRRHTRVQYLYIRYKLMQGISMIIRLTLLVMHPHLVLSRLSHSWLLVPITTVSTVLSSTIVSNPWVSNPWAAQCNQVTTETSLTSNS